MLSSGLNTGQNFSRVSKCETTVGSLRVHVQNDNIRPSFSLFRLRREYKFHGRNGVCRKTGLRVQVTRPLHTQDQTIDFATRACGFQQFLKDVDSDTSSVLRARAASYRGTSEIDVEKRKSYLAVQSSFAISSYEAIFLLFAIALNIGHRAKCKFSLVTH